MVDRGVGCPNADRAKGGGDFSIGCGVGFPKTFGIGGSCVIDVE